MIATLRTHLSQAARGVIARPLAAAGFELRRKAPTPAPFIPYIENYSLVYNRDLQSCDFSFWIANRDAEQWYKNWFHAADCPTWELREFSMVLNRGDRVLEVGCHHGFLTLMISHVVGDDGCVCAVDANPENALIASAQIGLNNLCGRVRVVHAAVGASANPYAISLQTNSHVQAGQASGPIATVPGTTGDALDALYGPFNALKIDVEGFECAVLEGCTNILARQPKLLIEVHPDFMRDYGYGGSVDRLLDLISFKNYTGTIVIRPRFENSIPFSAENVPRSAVSNLHLVSHGAS